MTICEQVIRRTVRELNPRWRLTGMQALTGRATALRVSSGSKKSARLILLTHSQRDRERNPHIARHEFQLLNTLKNAGQLVPEALYLSITQQPPFLITEFMEGSARLETANPERFSRRLAAILYDIHSISLRRFDLSFLSQPLPVASGRGDRLSQTIDSRTGGRFSSRSSRNIIHEALVGALPRVEFNAPALLHGDFWPGNLLWNGGELAAIIDWEDAMLGDPLADLGKSRLEILWALGHEALNVYTAEYLSMDPTLNATALPFWDLWGASRLAHFPAFAPSPDAIPRMRAQYDAFVADAIRRLEAL